MQLPATASTHSHRTGYVGSTPIVQVVPSTLPIPSLTMSSQTPPLSLTRENIQRFQLDLERDEAQWTDAQRETYLNELGERLRAKEREFKDREDALNRGTNNPGASICEVSSSQEEFFTEVRHDRRERE